MSARKRRGRGEGSVFYDEARKCWSATVSLGVIDGRRVRETVRAASKAEVLALMDDAKRRRDEARQCASGAAAPVTVAELVDGWLAAGAVAGLEASTLAKRRGAVEKNLLPRLGGRDAPTLVARDIADYYAAMRADGVGRCAAWEAARCLRAAFCYAVTVGALPADPGAALPLPAYRAAEAVCLTAAQSRALLAASAGMSYHSLLALALGSGMRLQELLALAWSAVDLEKGVVHVRQALAADGTVKAPKTRASRRSITLPAFATDALRGRRREAEGAGLGEAPVFCTRRGGYHDKKTAGRCVRPAAAAARAAGAEVPAGLTFHGLRHTHASLLLSAGMSVKAVAARLGHADASTLLRIYSHCLPGDDAALADKAQSLLG